MAHFGCTGFYLSAEAAHRSELDCAAHFDIVCVPVQVWSASPHQTHTVSLAFLDTLFIFSAKVVVNSNSSFHIFTVSSHYQKTDLYIWHITRVCFQIWDGWWHWNIKQDAFLKHCSTFASHPAERSSFTHIFTLCQLYICCRPTPLHIFNYKTELKKMLKKMLQHCNKYR